jgi:hypothetical protein
MGGEIAVWQCLLAFVWQRRGLGGLLGVCTQITRHHWLEAALHVCRPVHAAQGAIGRQQLQRFFLLALRSCRMAAAGVATMATVLSLNPQLVFAVLCMVMGLGSSRHVGKCVVECHELMGWLPAPTGGRAQPAARQGTRVTS